MEIQTEQTQSSTDSIMTFFEIRLQFVGSYAIIIFPAQDAYTNCHW